MCTIVVLRRPGHPWPVLIAANRDELIDRPWQPPGRHWPDRAGIVAGRDELGNGSWLGINDHGVVAAVLNRLGTLGPAPGLKSRGRLPLAALAHASAREAADALADLDPRAFRPFNLVIIDRRDGFWLRAADHGGDGPAAALRVAALPEGLSMITAHDCNDPASPRIRRYRPQFAVAAVPDPDAGDWRQWQALLADRSADDGAGAGGAMTVITGSGFETVSSSLIALPAAGSGRKPVWLFAPGRPGANPYGPVAL